MKTAFLACIEVRPISLILEPSSNDKIVTRKIWTIGIFALCVDRFGISNNNKKL
jgi:hypothetical protein